MRQYRVWTHPSGLTEAVKHGWSWPAFLFGGLWAIAKRMTLIGIFMLLGSLVIGGLMATQVEDEDGIWLFALTLLLGLFFGANGNSWREWILKKRGFVPDHTNVQTKIPPFQTLFSHPIVGLRTLWHDPVWSKVIATIIVGVLGVFGVYILRTPSTIDHADSANIAPYHFSSPRCKSATIKGAVQGFGAETLVWFEWGETPDLGNVTMKQRFTEDTGYYQDIVDLKENTTYYYRAMASDINGTAEGRVNSFTTARCER